MGFKFNVNTPEDLEKAKQMAAQKQTGKQQ
jgi:GTP:adenosylcobinamide-phosphate guanylyltransferase